MLVRRARAGVLLAGLLPVSGTVLAQDGSADDGEDGDPLTPVEEPAEEDPAAGTPSGDASPDGPSGAGDAAAPVVSRLPIGSSVEVDAAPGDDAVLVYEAEEAGVLTAVARAGGETDLVLFVTDADGQTLPRGRVDDDVDGARGAEQIAVTVPAPGTYQVRAVVRTGGARRVLVGGSFLPLPQLASQPDPDGRPSAANALAVGARLEDAIDPARGDRWDWFTVTAERSGELTVRTRAPEGDLVLQAYAEGDYFEPLERSDDDLAQVRGDERIGLDVEAGATYLLRVRSISTAPTTGEVPYEISAELTSE